MFNPYQQKALNMLLLATQACRSSLPLEDASSWTLKGLKNLEKLGKYWKFPIFCQARFFRKRLGTVCNLFFVSQA